MITVTAPITEASIEATTISVNVQQTPDTLDNILVSSASTTATINTQTFTNQILQTTYNVALSTSALHADGLPTNGTTGQILAKASNADYDTTWIDNYTSTVKHIVKATTTILKGQAVYVSSATGTNMLVSKASNASEATSSRTFGILAQDLNTNDQGFVITEGLLAGLDTSTANIGDPIFLGTNGNLLYGLANKPSAPNHLVSIGVVTRINQNNGEIFVKIANGFEVEELHNVNTSTKQNGYAMTWNSSTQLYEFTAPNLYIQNGTPTNTPAQYLWIQTGLGTSGTDLTFWIGS